MFLGLGLPWVIATIYSSMHGVSYYAPAGTLSFSVVVFIPCALVAITLLIIKRVFDGGELGGSGFRRIGFSLIMAGLWILYLLLSGLESSGTIKGF